MSLYKSYEQGVAPKCTLMAITKAVVEACKKDHILLDFGDVEGQLQQRALDNNGAFQALMDSDNEDYDNVPGVGRGYEPTEFNNISVGFLKNLAMLAEDCLIKIYVLRVADQSSDTKFSDKRDAMNLYRKNKEYVIVDLNTKLGHTMYVVWLIKDAGGYFLCRNTKELGDRDGTRYKTVPTEMSSFELFEVQVRVKRRIGPRTYMKARQKSEENYERMKS